MVELTGTRFRLLVGIRSIPQKYKAQPTSPLMLLERKRERLGSYYRLGRLKQLPLMVARGLSSQWEGRRRTEQNDQPKQAKGSWDTLEGKIKCNHDVSSVPNYQLIETIQYITQSPLTERYANPESMEKAGGFRVPLIGLYERSNHVSIALC